MTDLIDGSVKKRCPYNHIIPTFFGQKMAMNCCGNFFRKKCFFCGLKYLVGGNIILRCRGCGKLTRGVTF